MASHLQQLLTLEKENNLAGIEEYLSKHQDALETPEVLYYIGHTYYVGFGKKVDKVLAAKYLGKAAAKDYAPALYALSLMFEKGDGIEADFESANKALLQAVELKYVKAINHYGEVLLKGRYGMPRNDVEAFNMFYEAKELGDQDALMNFAQCLVFEIGCCNRGKEGLDIIVDFANKGDVEAVYLLGKCFHEGKGIPRNPIKANYYLLKASEMGHAKASRLLGDCYYDGDGVNVDHHRAYLFYKRAVALGDTDSCNVVTHCLLFGDGVGKNLLKAVDYCVKAAQAGNKDAQVALGNRYFRGDGFEKNFDRAFYWYQQAIKQEDPYGYKNAADMLVEGNGCKVDLEKAEQYYLKAIEGENYSACYPLGLLYENGGKNFKPDYELAVKYYQMAYDHDYADGAFAYGVMNERGKGVPYPDYAKAAKAFEFAANKRYVPALKKAGEYYLKGIGVNKDYEKALRYYSIAGENGDDESLVLVQLIRRDMEFLD